MKIRGIKEAVGRYQRGNEGWLSPYYARLMFDPSDCSVWTDLFCSIGHNEWKVYHDKNIVCLSNMIEADGKVVNMKNVKEYAEKKIQS